MPSKRILLGLASLFLLGASRPALADETESMQSTPRATLELFLNTTDAGRYTQATEAFPAASHGGADLARELRAVVDEYLKIDLTKVSDSTDGTTVDIGRIPTEAAASRSA